MIGQKGNIRTLSQWRCNKSIPRFIIISGDDGSGRLTFAKLIIKTMHMTGIIIDCKIDSVRDAISQSYSCTAPTMYIFRGADEEMSVAAKNALLKVVEEPPNNAYFAMTVSNIDNMLGTIRSRASIIKMEPYSFEELKSYKDDDFLLKYSTNIGQLQIDKKDLEKACGCAENVIKALKEKSGTKLLKACTQLRSKQSETEKIEGSLFMRVFEKSLFKISLSVSCLKYLSNCKKEISRKSVNKKASIESMLIKIMEELKNDI